MVSQDNVLSDLNPVQKAFSKQAKHYDEDDWKNQVLQDMRQQVYNHVSIFLKEKRRILELNAGTGIDALHFANQGHWILATDASEGMAYEIEKKIIDYKLQERFYSERLSYDQLGQLAGQTFDYVFSNFGGLNCIDDLTKVTGNLPKIITPGAYITWVIMPPVCVWELLWIFKGYGGRAFRRFHKNGVIAHLEGEYFKTYYHSLSKIKKAFGPHFRLIKSEGLCALSPPPSRGDFAVLHPRLYRFLRRLDSGLRSKFPFNRWADHIIVTFQFDPQ
jgi:ubiquinone/menaquinone biosynthesis C-methylase UbiE